MYICRLHVLLVLTEVRRGCWIPRNWSYGWLWTIMPVLGIELGCSVRNESALNHWVPKTVPKTQGFWFGGFVCFCLFLNVKKYFHIFCWKQQLFDISITGTLKYRRSVFRCYSNANIAILRAHPGNRDGGGKKMKERWKHGSVSVPHHPVFQEWPLLPCPQRLQESQGTKTATAFLFLPPDRGPGSTKPWHHHHDILLSDLIVRVLPVLSQRGYTERHAAFASEI